MRGAFSLRHRTLQWLAPSTLIGAAQQMGMGSFAADLDSGITYEQHVRTPAKLPVLSIWDVKTHREPVGYALSKSGDAVHAKEEVCCAIARFGA